MDYTPIRYIHVEFMEFFSYVLILRVKLNSSYMEATEKVILCHFKKETAGGELTSESGCYVYLRIFYTI